MRVNVWILKRWRAGTWMTTSQAASTCSQAARGCPPGWTCPKHLHLEARHQNSGPAQLFISPHSQTRCWVGAVTPLIQTPPLFTFEDHGLIFIPAWGHQPTSRDPWTPPPLYHPACWKIRQGEKEHSWQSPTLTRDEPDSLLAMWPELPLPRYRDHMTLRLGALQPIFPLCPGKN